MPKQRHTEVFTWFLRVGGGVILVPEWSGISGTMNKQQSKTSQTSARNASATVSVIRQMTADMCL